MINLPTPRQLRYLTALAESRHFGRAALACNVTQSTLSAGIQELESLLGAALVDRTRRKTVLTPLGQAMAAKAADLLRQAEEMVLLARTQSEPLAGPLHLGVIPTVSPFLLPRVLPALRRKLPKLKLYLREDLTERLVEQLQAGKLDLLLLALPIEAAAVQTWPLFPDAFRFACRKEHPLAGRGKVALPALAQESLLLLEDGHCLRDHALDACHLPRPAKPESLAATSLHTLVQMVDNGLGVTLLPDLALDAGILRGTNVVTRPLVEPAAKNPPSRTIGLAWRAGTQRASEFKLFGEALLAAMSKQKIQKTEG
ncbi:hydrogen peroxide-inducible genes activator [Ferrovibrio sp.]|uniref:hydrogen peroxide-inducible genes activator n=1 Tax=Ferrovibrio sp. TaxID=1917215 RepID=UPI0025C445BD|nr:hydrogen peroxide-inducible genes activator [Ferrovibrio sp.]MBX3453877.1 hydrogen peroxide-inducible genes activator [Ferrovibrio sp.]